jgi:hypothetical protein
MNSTLVQPDNSNCGPFSGDKLNRKEFGEKLVHLIKELPKGVIAIDGEWGNGKTWFGKNIQKSLAQDTSKDKLNEGYKSIWIDAFQSEWEDDPALSLIAGIAAQLEPKLKKSFIQDLKPILGAVVPTIAKLAAQSTAKLIGIGKEDTQEIKDVIEQVTESYFNKYIDDLINKRKNLDAAKELLNGAVENLPNKKLIIFVDELDRCSPEYAIRFMERIKHLFDIEGVIYVLLWNRKQIQKAVETFYGVGTNGEMYLDRFIDIPLYLRISHSRDFEEPLKEFINEIINVHVESEKDLIQGVSKALRLNAREVMRVCAWYKLSRPKNPNSLLVWLLALKAKYPDVFAGIRSDDSEAHQKAIELLKKIEDKEANNAIRTKSLINLHECYANKNFDKIELMTKSEFEENTISAKKIDKVIGTTIKDIEVI